MTRAANDTREQGVTLVALQVENVMRLKCVRVRPDGAPLFVVGGDNDQGKSSLLNSIQMLIGGGKMPAAPLREGETDGLIRGEFSNGMVAERSFWPGGTKLEVRRRAGGKPVSGPQGVLDELYDSFAFEPLDFLAKKPAEQTEILMRALKLDFSDLDDRHASVFDERKIVNHKVKTLKGAIEEATRYPDAPRKEVSIAELAEELKAAHASNASRAQLVQYVNRAAEARSTLQDTVQRLERELAAARAQLIERDADLDAAEESLRAADDELDTAPIEQRLQDAEQLNRKVRANQEVAAQEYELVDLEAKADELTEQLKDIQLEKGERLAAARFPVEGLGFGELGPTLDELPFEQAAMSRKLRVVAAMAFRLLPQLKILLVRRGSELNTKNLQLLAELADAEGGQAWVERVSEDGKDCSIVLEDGMVQGAPAAAE